MTDNCNERKLNFTVRNTLFIQNKKNLNICELRSRITYIVYLHMLKHTLIKATLAGAKILQQYFNGSFTVSSKSNINDLVTQADKESEAAIFEVIRKEFPDHYLLSEEAGELKMDSNIKWIIDPIDGTVNFANGIPICCVSIGVEQD